MIAAFWTWWAQRRFRRWSAEQQRRYAARRAMRRAVFLDWLRGRELPGSPTTLQPGGGMADEP